MNRIRNERFAFGLASNRIRKRKQIQHQNVKWCQSSSDDWIDHKFAHHSKNLPALERNWTSTWLQMKWRRLEYIIAFLLLRTNFQARWKWSMKMEIKATCILECENMNISGYLSAVKLVCGVSTRSKY